MHSAGRPRLDREVRNSRQGGRREVALPTGPSKKATLRGHASIVLTTLNDW